MSRRLFIRGARQLLTLRGPSGPRRGPAMRDLAIIEDGAVLVEDGRISQVGPTRRLENLAEARHARTIDATGRVVMPGFVDAHTHVVHGPPRLADYEMRLAGRTYQEIAAAGGGIVTSMRAVRAWAASRLEREALSHLRVMAMSGTTTLEGKTGYGLELSAELKVLRVMRRLDGRPLNIVPTFLGPHTVPPEFEGRADAFVDSLIADVLPEVAKKHLAVFADAYCDTNAFTLAQTLRFLEAAQAAGLGLKVHASQFANLGAVEAAIELDATSVDHLEAIEGPQVAALAHSPAIAVLLPASVLHLGLSRYAPARALVDAGAAVALATDFNPGSSPTPAMPLVISLACSQMRMDPAEAIAAATINGAHALRAAQNVGSLEAGKQADILVLEAGDYRELPYYAGANLVHRTIKNGIVLQEEPETLWRDAL